MAEVEVRDTKTKIHRDQETEKTHKEREQLRERKRERQIERKADRTI